MSSPSHTRPASHGNPRPSLGEILRAGIAALVGIGLLGWLDSHWLVGTPLLLLIGSFGASAVLVYGAPSSPFAQPRNLLLGQIGSAAIGVAVALYLPAPAWLLPAVAVALSIMLMQALRAIHPPGGATALIAVIGGPSIQGLGWSYVLLPVALGSVLLLLVALLANNLLRTRPYPQHWW